MGQIFPLPQVCHSNAAFKTNRSNTLKLTPLELAEGVN
jgi:hypothetical protein